MNGSSYPERGRRRPVWVLLRWINTIVSRQRYTYDLHFVFSDGLTLCSIVQRVHPASQLTRFRRVVTRGAALSNTEQALALIWQLSPQAASMPSAEQILDGTPRELILRFISELFTIFVVRPSRARLRFALPWFQQFLLPYTMALSDSTLIPPHTTLGSELRSGAAIAIALHALLPPSRLPGLDGGVYGCPHNEEEREVSVRVIFAILEEQRLSPCRWSTTSQSRVSLCRLSAHIAQINTELVIQCKCLRLLSPR